MSIKNDSWHIHQAVGIDTPSRRAFLTAASLNFGELAAEGLRSLNDAVILGGGGAATTPLL